MTPPTTCCSDGVRRVDSPSRCCCIPSLGPAIKVVQEEGSVALPDVQWSTKLDHQILPCRLLAEAAYGCSREALPQNRPVTSASSSTQIQHYAASSPPSLNNSSSKPLWTLLSGHSYRFAREVKEAFPDATNADWTGLLQWALALPSNSIFYCEEKERIFEALSEMFILNCRDFAEKLIDESFLPEEERTIKPDLRFGGTAGGKKFTHHSEGTVLFKFAEDVLLGASASWVYGGLRRDDRLAMKSAGHELKSTQALINAGVSELKYPMMAAFTYRGKRVLCASLLPIKGKASLVQGKDTVSDAMKIPLPHVDAVMQSMAARLWLARSRRPGEEIYGPFDMEIHEVDASLYMIDAAQLFPPEYRKGAAPGPRQMYQLLRPELLRIAGKERGLVLVPDALRFPDEKARRDLVEVSNMLDAQMAELARELAQEASGPSVITRCHQSAAPQARAQHAPPTRADCVAPSWQRSSLAASVCS
jgi:hypothetical protein